MEKFYTLIICILPFIQFLFYDNYSCGLISIKVQYLMCKFSSVHQGVFSAVVGGKRRGRQEDGEERPKNKRSRKSGKDEDYYIPYRPKDFNSERG